MQVVEQAGSPSAARNGFSLVEAVIAIALVGIALLGLAQMFTFSVANNAKADKMSSAAFLAQQQIDALRNLTAEELTGLAGPVDELLDVNKDGIVDFRRITDLQSAGVSWSIRVLVFQGPQTGITAAALVQNPTLHRAKADIGTVISR